VIQIFCHVLDDLVGRTQRRQDIDESEHLSLEHRVSHRPFHQTPVEIPLPKETGSAIIRIDQIKNLPANSLYFGLNCRDIAHEPWPGSIKPPKSEEAKSLHRFQISKDFVSDGGLGGGAVTDSLRGVAAQSS